MNQYVDIALAFVGGLGMFIYGMSVMAEGLQKSAGSRMKQLLAFLTTNKFVGVMVGLAVTAIIQSSSATTVMIVGFVNAGLMNLTQAVGVIMGANIGTTVTSWIVSSVEWAEFLNPVKLAPVATAVGAGMVLFSSKEKTKQVGEIIVGFGILFVGMNTMSGAVRPLRESEVFRQAFVAMGSNPLLGILAGTVITGIIQSSSASVGILQSLALIGLVPWNAAVYIIMGQNIGTCVTALLSSIGTSKNAKSAAYIHLLFNIFGSAVFSCFAIIFFYYINPVFGLVAISVTEISIVHTLFNIANTIMQYRFSDTLIRLAQAMANLGKTTGASEGELQHLDDRVLATPEFAIKSCVEELVRMGRLAKENLSLACDALLEPDAAKAERVFKREKSINELDKSITTYIAKISRLNLSEDQRNRVTSFFHTVSDIERVGDHAENIAESAMEAVSDGVVFSPSAKSELKEISGEAIRSFEDSIAALESGDQSMALKVVKEEVIVDELERNMRERHIQRLGSGECTSLSGVLFIDSISNLERVADHALNIAQTVIGKEKGV